MPKTPDLQQDLAPMLKNALSFPFLCFHMHNPSHLNRRYLTWDSSVFPHPAELQNDVASRGRKTVTIVDPHVKRDPSYNIYQHAQQKQYFVRTKDGGEFDG